MAGWSALAAIGGSAISGLGASGASSASAHASKFMYKHRYQWTVNDLKAAGLNPMLAYTQGAPVPSQPDVKNVGEAAVEGGVKGFSAVQAAKLNQAAIAKTKADTETSKAQAVALQAGAVKDQASAAAAYNSINVQNQQIEESKQSVLRMQKEVESFTQNIVESKARQAVDQKQLEVLKANIGLLGAQQLQVAAQGRLQGAEADKLIRTMDALVAIVNSERRVAESKGVQASASQDLMNSPAGAAINAYMQGGLPGLLLFLGQGLGMATQNTLGTGAGQRSPGRVGSTGTW